MKALTWAHDSIRQRGWLRTSRIASSNLHDFLFDWRYGTETRRRVDLEEFRTDSENRVHAVHYAATKARPFMKLLGELSLPPDSVFVDLGSGKGRVLLLAAQTAFRQVIGVEFCPQLCQQARANIATFSKAASLSAPIEVIEADVTTFPIGSDANVFYLYNPFNPPVLLRVIDNIRQSLARAPRPVWLIYNTPLHDELLRSCGLFHDSEIREIGGTEFRIYRG